MDQAQSKGNQDHQNAQKLFCKQPISCPWIATQPYPSTVNKNRAGESTVAKAMPNIPLSMESRTVNDKTCPSLQHSSSQFFYFLRLMQLFPETHPATLHTVLCLCKNDFFCAVDKLLYAKRCKTLYSRSQGMFKRCSVSRSHPYCGFGGSAKVTNQQDKGRSSESMINANVKEFVDVHGDSDVAKMQAVGEKPEVGEQNNGIPLTMTSTENASHVQTTTITASSLPSDDSNNEDHRKTLPVVTSPGANSMPTSQSCEKSAEP